MDITLTKQWLLLLIILIAVVIDWRTNKIPNLLTFPAALIGLVLNYMSGEWAGVMMAIAAWFLAALIMIFLGGLPMGPGGTSGGIGMGDAKLIAAVGAFLGPKAALIDILYFCLFFGLMACVILASKVPWRQVWLLVSTLISDGDISGLQVDTTKLAEQRKAMMPVSLAILCATLMTIYYEPQTLAFLGFH